MARLDCCAILLVRIYRGGVLALPRANGEAISKVPGPASADPHQTMENALPRNFRGSLDLGAGSCVLPHARSRPRVDRRTAAGVHVLRALERPEPAGGINDRGSIPDGSRHQPRAVPHRAQLGPRVVYTHEHHLRGDSRSGVGLRTQASRAASNTSTTPPNQQPKRLIAPGRRTGGTCHRRRSRGPLLSFCCASIQMSITQLLELVFLLQFFKWRKANVKLFGAFAFEVDRCHITIKLYDRTVPKDLVAYAIALVQIRYITRLIGYFG